MKKITLSLLLFAVTCFTFGQTTVTKSYVGPTVTVDGCGTYCVALPGVTFTAADFPGCGPITDVNVSIDWLKTDGSCAAPGAGNSFHNETNFRIDGPAAMEILATPGTWTGAVSSPPVTTVFDQAAAGPPVVGTPVSGTFQPVGGNLDNFNGLAALGTWILSAGDTAGADPLCVIAYSVTITVLDDTTPPVIACPADVTVNNDAGVCGAAFAYAVGFGDNCPGATLMQTAGLPSGSVFPIGTTTNSFTVTDTSGNTASCSFDVTVNDTEPPVITCPADIVVSNDPGVCGATVAYATPMGTDNCPGSTTVQTAGQASGTVFPVGTTTNTFEVTDASGNTASCSFDVTVNDVEDPTITCPADITVSNDPGLCSAVVNYTVTGTDNCTPGTNVIPNQTGTFTGNARGYWFVSPANFTMTGLRVPDDASAAPQNVQVMRFAAPPANFPGTSSYDALLHWSGSVPGNSFIAVSIPIAQGDIIGILGTRDTNSTNSYTSSATDMVIAGINVPIARFGTQTDIHLAPAPDGTFWTEPFGVNPNKSRVEFEFDSPVFVQTAGLPSGSAFPEGTTTNTYVAFDNAGNSATCSFDVTVNDTEPPNAVCATGPIQNPSEAGVPLGQPIPATGTSGPMTPSVATVGQSGIIGTDYNINTVELDLNHTFDGDLDINLTSPMGTVLALSNDNGGSGNNYTGTIFQDGGANINAGSAPFTGIFEPEGGTFAAAFGGENINGNWTLNINDQFGGDSGQLLNFRINFMGLTPGPVEVFLDATGNASITAGDIDAGSTDNCGIASTSIDITDFTCADIGINVVTLTVTDTNGNVSTCTSDVLVIDDIPPVAVCQDITVQLDANGMASITADQLDGGSTDNCAITFSASQTDFDCSDVGVVVVTLTVTDEGGNTDTCTANVTVEDNVPPEITCPADITVNNDPGDCGAIVNYETTNASILFSEFFPAGAGDPNCGAWATFESQLLAGLNYQSVTMSGDNDPGGITMSDPILVAQLADALRTNSSITLVDGPNTWRVGGCGPNVELSVNQAICFCDNPGYSIRPCLANGNWGGVNSATCGAPAQTMSVEFIHLVPGGPIMGTDNCPGSTTMQTAGLSSGSFFPVGTTTNTFVVTDASGNTATCSFDVTVVDNEPPTIVCPADVMTTTDPGECSAVVSFPDALALDNCGVMMVEQTDGLPSGSAFPLGVNTVEFTATDIHGNTSTCILTITVVDDEDPVVVCNDLTVELDAAGNVTVDVNDVATVTDNCPGATILFGGLTPGALTTTFTTNNGSAGNMFDVMPLNDITVNSFDVNNSSGTTVDYEIYFKVGTYVGSETTAGDWALVGSALGVPGNGQDNATPLGLSMGVNLTAGNVYAFYVADIGPGTHRYVNGGTAGDLWASDANLEIYEGAGKGGLFGSTFSPRNFSGTIIYEFGNPPSTTIDFDCDDVGPNTVQVTATDASGNTATCMTTITVEDNIAPVIVCIGEQVVGPNTESDSPGTAILDNSTVSTTITVPDSYTITDLNIELDITHTWVGDLQITLESPASTQVLIFDGGSDGCSGDNIMDLYDDESANPLDCQAGTSDAFPLADYIPSNALSAFDGEDSAGVWTLFVEDTAGGDQGTINSWSIIYDFDPIVAAPLEVDLDANGMATINASDLLMSVDEACGWTATVPGAGAPVSLETTFAGGNGNFGNMFDMNALNDVTIESFDIHGDNGATFDVEVYAKTGTYVGFETDPGAWTLIGTAPGVVSNGDGVATPLDLMLGYEMSAGETHAFYVTPTDFSTGGFNYTNGTAVGNVFASDANIEFLEGSGSGYPFNGTLFSPRVWNGNIIYTAAGGTSTTIDFTCDDLGENIIEVTVTDDSGNVATCMATVNVNDVTPPVLICMDVTIELGEDGTAEIDPNDLLATMPGTFEVISISSDNQSGAVGNTDLTVPVTAADNITFDWMYNTSDGPAFDSFGYLLNGVFTEVIDPGGANTQMGTTGPIAVAPGDVFGFRSTSVDGLLGPSTTVVSNFIPGFTGQFEPANWTLTLDNSDGDAFFVEIPGGPLSFDACGITILAADVTEVTCDDIGTPITVTVFASDSSLNIAVCQSEVTVVDLLPPVMTCPADQTVDPGVGNLFWEVEDYFALGTASALDNCTDPVAILTQDPLPGTLLPDGVYTITITGEDEYGNVGTCTFELTVESILGVDDNTIDVSTIVMYPNPAGDVVNISNPQSIDLEQVAIYDALGRLIQTYDLRDMGTEKALDISQLSTATYLVVIQGAGGQITKQLIKE